jgi:hypothetical protein
VTVKVDDEFLNDLLPPKADSQLAGADFLPQGSMQSFNGENFGL